jgi:hypothetical protein
MKRLFLTIALAVGGLGSLASSAQAHPYNHCGYHCGYHGGYNCGYHGGYNCGYNGYWYWNHGCRFWRVVVVPGPVFYP